MATVNVKYGVNSLSLGNLVGLTVRDASSQVRAVMGVPEGATAMLNGDTAGLDQVLREGDTLTFYKASGEKGATIKYGVNQISHTSVDNVPLGTALNGVKGILQLPDTENVQVTVNGNPQPRDYVVQPGDTVVVYKQSGEKGN